MWGLWNPKKLVEVFQLLIKLINYLSPFPVPVAMIAREQSRKQFHERWAGGMPTTGVGIDFCRKDSNWIGLGCQNQENLWRGLNRNRSFLFMEGYLFFVLGFKWSVMYPDVIGKIGFQVKFYGTLTDILLYRSLEKLIYYVMRKETR